MTTRNLLSQVLHAGPALHPSNSAVLHPSQQPQPKNSTGTASGSGFTLIEVLLVLAILSIILLLTLAFTVNAIERTQLRSARNIIVQTLRRAHTRAVSNVENAAWGIYFCPEPLPAECTGLSRASVVIFKRTVASPSFSTYSTTNDQGFEHSAQVSFSGALYTNIKSGATGLQFTRLTGDPNFTGTLVLTLDRDTKSILVNEKGGVEY